MNAEGEIPIADVAKRLAQSGVLISAFDEDGWILAEYPANTEGTGVWIAPDGGIHFGPGESGYYPWKEAIEGEGEDGNETTEA